MKRALAAVCLVALCAHAQQPTPTPSVVIGITIAAEGWKVFSIGNHHYMEKGDFVIQILPKRPPTDYWFEPPQLPETYTDWEVDVNPRSPAQDKPAFHTLLSLPEYFLLLVFDNGDGPLLTCPADEHGKARGCRIADGHTLDEAMQVLVDQRMEQQKRENQIIDDWRKLADTDERIIDQKNDRIARLQAANDSLASKCGGEKNHAAASPRLRVRNKDQ